MRFSVIVLLSASLTFFSFPGATQSKQEPWEPEAATGYQHKKAFYGDEYMISAANPYASWAGKNIMSKGGNAIDAAVAIQAMLNLVEPQSSGIGGGSFILYWDNKTKKLHTFDGRETAPSKANAYLFMEDNKPVKWIDAVVGGRSVGVPGTLKALDMAHKEFGHLPWRDLFTDAINMAENGFKVSPRLEKLVDKVNHKGLLTFRESNIYFYPGGKPLKQGVLRKNLALARVFLEIANKGIDDFYTGAIAEKIVQAVQTADINPGLLSMEDMAAYNAKKRSPVCSSYKTYRVCGMAPPSSGGINVNQILTLLESYKLEQYQPNSLEAMHLFTQASRLAYADRDMFVADSDFTQLPFAAMINRTYLGRRASSISAKKDMGYARPGNPYPNAFLGLGEAYELPNTSHISIVDKEGNAVSMTTSIEFAFGSGLMVEGFLLNNQLTDFSFLPTNGNYPTLNRVEPNKRPRSAMSPTMVFDDKGELVLVVGSPGGSRIISYVAQTIIGVLDWDLDIQQAINLPKVTNRNDYTALEKGTSAEKLQDGFEKLGHQVKVIDLNSGLHGIHILKDNPKGKLEGGADPRREGVAVGQ